MTLKITIASKEEEQEIIDFFEKHIKKDTDWLYNQEFVCPFGTKWAIKKWKIIVAKYQGNIVGALRFYRQKRQNIISLYQFAISESHRGKWLIKKILLFLGSPITVHSRCCEESIFNEYYSKSWWKLNKTDKLWNLWELKIKDNLLASK